MKSHNWNCLGWKGPLRLSGPPPHNKQGNPQLRQCSENPSLTWAVCRDGET